MVESAVATGVVKFYKTEEGWGAIASSDLPGPGDAFVHFSAIDGSGYRELVRGETVSFDFEPVQQDGFRYVATHVRRLQSGSVDT